jgi:hypothetical protein
LQNEKKFHSLFLPLSLPVGGVSVSAKERIDWDEDV